MRNMYGITGFDDIFAEWFGERWQAERNKAR
jgi:hypothetical protein